MIFPKVNNPTKILNAKIKEKTKPPKNETTFFEKKKGERQLHRKEAEEGSTTQREREKVLFEMKPIIIFIIIINLIYNYNNRQCVGGCLCVWV